MEPAPGLAWTAGQVARQLGVSESTLRTWHRRYGLSPDGAEPGRYRRYREDDVARLRRMVDLVRTGMLASEAARAVQLNPAQVSQEEAGGPADSRPGVPAPVQEVADLLAAARAMDSVRCGSLLDALFTRSGVVDAWELVCRPALRKVDAEPRHDPWLIGVEHTLSWALLGALLRRPRLAAEPGPDLVLLACAADEQHTLPLAALAAALAERARPSRMLGPATPAETLAQAVRETRPGAVVLWAQSAQTASPGALGALAGYPVQRFAAGPGWPARTGPDVRRVTSLRGALAALSGEPRSLPVPPRALSRRRPWIAGYRAPGLGGDGGRRWFSRCPRLTARVPALYGSLNKIILASKVIWRTTTATDWR